MLFDRHQARGTDPFQPDDPEHDLIPTVLAFEVPR